MKNYSKTTVNAYSSKSSRKAIIYREAAGLFREKGYRASTLREIAKRSGVQGGSIYYHFRSKQDILYQIMDFTMNALIKNLKKEIKGEKDPLEEFRKAMRFHIEYHINHLNETRASDEEIRSLNKENYDSIIARRHNYADIFIQILKKGVQNGVMNIDNLKLTSMAVLQMCTGVSYWFRHDGPLNASDVANKYADIICWGIAKKAKHF